MWEKERGRRENKRVGRKVNHRVIPTSCKFLLCMLYPTTVLVWFPVTSGLGMRLLQLFKHTCNLIFAKLFFFFMDSELQVAQSIV